MKTNQIQLELTKVHFGQFEIRQSRRRQVPRIGQKVLHQRHAVYKTIADRYRLQKWRGTRPGARYRQQRLPPQIHLQRSTIPQFLSIQLNFVMVMSCSFRQDNVKVHLDFNNLHNECKTNPLKESKKEKRMKSE